MDAPDVHTQPIRRFLDLLGERTADSWRHLFTTTNWDYLLQREIDRMFPQSAPRWLPESWVFHFNGTVEALPDNTRRSCFLLEDDPAELRIQTLEGDIAFHRMIWESLFVVVGMSFECEPDKFLVRQLNSVEDDLPIGQSDWLIVNPDEVALNVVHDCIQRALPRANVRRVCHKFTDWQETQFPELRGEGVFRE